MWKKCSVFEIIAKIKKMKSVLVKRRPVQWGVNLIDTVFCVRKKD